MSYILDALKKAERERDIARVPTLMTVHENNGKSSHGRYWTFLGICLGCAAVIIWLTAYLVGPKTAPPLSPAANSRDNQSLPAPESQDSKNPIPSPQRFAPSENVLLPAIPAESGNPRTSPSASSPAKKRETGVIGPSSQRQVEQQPEAAPAAERIATQLQPLSPNLTETITEETSPTEQDHSTPASLNEAMAKMTMTILLYSDVKSERMAFINDRKYLEGEYIDGRYLLESITPEGALLNFQGERGLLRPRAK